MDGQDKSDWTRVVHVYSPYDSHGECVVAGDRRGMVALRDAIDKALAVDGEAADTFGAMTADGEGFDGVVAVLDKATFASLKLPYRQDDEWDRGGDTYPLNLPVIHAALKKAWDKQNRKE